MRFYPVDEELLSMKMENDTENNLKKSIQSDINKIEKSKRERNSLFAQTVYLGTLGLIFILPVIVGAYLGVWLDSKNTGFTISWTISLIFLGVVVGAINVYLFIKE
jgi:ATP synthase protein I